MNELGFEQECVSICCDSQSVISLAKNAVHHERTKHIAVKFHFIRGLINDGFIQVVKIVTTYKLADIFTNVLSVSKLQEALELLKVTDR